MQISWNLDRDMRNGRGLSGAARCAALGVSLTVAALMSVIGTPVRAQAGDGMAVSVQGSGGCTGGQKSCGGGASFDGTVTFASGRNFLIHVPAAYGSLQKEGKKAAFIVDIHGLNSTANDEKQISQQLEISDKRGFIVIWPESAFPFRGTPGEPDHDGSWNAFGCCATAFYNPPNGNRPDDVVFLKNAIQWVKENYAVADDRVYATGLSNGGSMIEKLACEDPEISAIAPVSAATVRTFFSCPRTSAISVMAFRGKQDATVPYDGGPDGMPGPAGQVDYKSAAEEFREWRRVSNCSNDELRSPVNDAHEAYELVAQNCTNNVRVSLVTLKQSDHVPFEQGSQMGVPGNNSMVYLAHYMWTNIFNQPAP